MRPTPQQLGHKLLDATERTLGQLERQARSRPAAAAAVAAIELGATIALFGLAPTLLAAAASWVTYDELRRRRGRSGPSDRGT